MNERDQLASCLRIMASVLRDLGLMASRADDAVLANTDLRAELDALSRSYDANRSVRAYAAVDEALAALERNANAKVVADWLVLQLECGCSCEAARRDYVGDPAGIGPEIARKAAADARVRTCASRCSTARHPARVRRWPAVGRCGRAAFDAICAAVRDAQAGTVHAVATAPVNKLAFSRAGLPWKGHTDLLGHLTAARGWR
jgi:hypothetical protein